MRKQFIEWLFSISQKIYTSFFKNHEAWNISKSELLKFPINSFGYHLGCFLNEHGFELIPKVERHDAYHTLCGFGINVEDEIALQCLCMGNGKRSPYMFGAVILGVLILPDYLDYYMKSYKIGKQCNTFHHYNYKNLLNINYNQFKKVIFNNEQIDLLNTIQFKLV